jgi:hypothetical protein
MARRYLVEAAESINWHAAGFEPDEATRARRYAEGTSVLCSELELTAFSQHYEYGSTMIDVTREVDIATFFASRNWRMALSSNRSRVNLLGSSTAWTSNASPECSRPRCCGARHGRLHCLTSGYTCVAGTRFTLIAVPSRSCADYAASTHPSKTHRTMDFQLWRTRHDSNMRPSDS